MTRSLGFLFSLVLWAATLMAQPTTLTFGLEGSSLPRAGQPGLRGNLPPLRWDQSLPLAGPDADGRYTLRLTWDSLPPAAQLSYKFVLEPDTWELEDAGNRLFLPQPGQDTVLPLARWDVKTRLAEARVIPAAQLQAEYALVEAAYRRLHPGLYRYHDSSSLDAHFAALKAALQQDLDLREAFVVYSRFAAGLRCGHTFCNFWNQGDEVQQVIMEAGGRLPFAFRLAEGQLVVTRSAVPGLEGAALTRLDGQPVDSVLARLLPLVKTDGHNEAHRWHMLQVEGYGSYEWFDIYYPLLFPVGDSLRVEGHHLLTGAPVDRWVPTLSTRARRDSLRQRYPDLPRSYDDLWRFAWVDSQTAMIQIGTFSTYQMRLDWQGFLREAFAEMREKGATRFILDIRGNGGGMDEVIYELGRYLVREPLRLPAWDTRLQYAYVPDSLRPYLGTWDPAVFDLRKRVRARPDGTYALKGGDKPLRVPGSREAFAGEVFVLIDGANSSATFLLAHLVRAGQLGTLVGRPTGGNLRGINGGNMFFLRLPYSGIELDIPLFGNFAPTPQPDQGLVPDIEVWPTAEEVARGVDVDVEAVRQIPPH